MGASSSKPDKNEALSLCKERRRFIKQAIDSRYALAACHVSYIQSLRNVGLALRRFAEAEVLIESSLSTSATEIDKTPSHCSYPSPSPSNNAEVPDSPFHDATTFSQPVLVTSSYMKSGGGGASAVTVRLSPTSTNSFVENDSMAFPMPPPPPHPETGSWDYFDTADDSESFRFVMDSTEDVNFDDVNLRDHRASESSKIESVEHKGYTSSSGVKASECIANGANVPVEPSNSRINGKVMGKDLCTEREDPSEFITHRAKDFVSSIKDVEHRFLKASESGREVSRMLEANKIRVGYSEAKGNSPALTFFVAFHHACCRGKTDLVSYDPPLHGSKIITWKRSTSSRSSSSRNPLASKDDVDDSGSDFIEEFCMIAGSHSSTLDRLYAWERKLYDEVKASESIHKDYDQKCNQLRHQFAKDCSTQVIDKNRAVAKDLHSRLKVALQSVDSISKRIEKIRDEELQPQLLELIQGLIRMWKAMLECHHAQYITISLAYHSRSSLGALQGDARWQIMAQLQNEIECFGLSFADWINSHTSYVEALNGWLQHCILQPQERSKSRRPFSPRRVLAPPIFVLCRDWLAGIRSLLSDELSDAIRSFLSDLHDIMARQGEELQKQQQQQQSVQEVRDGDPQVKDDEKSEDLSASLHCIHSSLTKVLDRMTKFSEASLKMYEDIRQKSETARVAYSNGRPTRF